MSHDKKGFRWWLFNKFGPEEVQNLVDHIDDLTVEGNAVTIVPMGDFPFKVMSPQGEEPEHISFNTNIERAAFYAGIDYGVGLLGGKSMALSEDEYESMANMDKKLTHGGNGGKMN